MDLFLLDILDFLELYSVSIK